MLDCALDSRTWLCWVPNEILNKAPLNTNICICCVPDAGWVILSADKVEWSQKNIKVDFDDATQYDVFNLKCAQIEVESDE